MTPAGYSFIFKINVVNKSITARTAWGFTGWNGHDSQLWNHLLNEAREQARAGLDRLPVIVGSDRDMTAVRAARANAVAA